MYASSQTNTNSINISTARVGGKLFSLMYFNCRSLLPKLDELAAFCSANNPDIECLVETWLCGDVLNNEVCIPNYSIVRQDEVDMVVELLLTFTTASGIIYY